MGSIKISPSILSADFSKLGSEIQSLEEGIPPIPEKLFK